MGRRFSRVIVIGVVLACLVTTATVRSSGTQSAGDYIVVLEDGISAAAHARRARLEPTHVYGSALNGYAATIDAATLAKLRSDRRVEAIERDQVFRLDDGRFHAAAPQPAQVTTRVVTRVGGESSPTAKIDGIDERIDIDIAILDTWIRRDHPDLNVVGRTDCVANRPPHKGRRDNAHGTMVAGLAAAIDNDIGVVGVAPGARIWSVRVIDQVGFGRSSEIACGLDWITRHANVIDVANMSLGGPANHPETSDRSCSERLSRIDAVHGAFCRSIRSGISVVVAAGNETKDVRSLALAPWPDAITVSAIVDTDGLPGGVGGAPASYCPFTDTYYREDDHLAVFSNFGEEIDISAPGTCAVSTYPGGRYAIGSGTSFSTPLVAGGAALYLANNPDATPAEVRDALIALRDPTPIPDDPDGSDEGVLDVSTL